MQLQMMKTYPSSAKTLLARAHSVRCGTAGNALALIASKLTETFSSFGRPRRLQQRLTETLQARVGSFKYPTSQARKARMAFHTKK